MSTGPQPGIGLGGSSSGSGGSIAEDMYFSNTLIRDTFTVDNPNRIYQGVTCAVVNGTSYDYYQYDTTASVWRDASLIFQGKDGVVQELIAGDNITINSDDPARPVITSTGGAGDFNNFTVQADAAALDAWSLANPSLLTDDMVALIKSDDDAVSAWLQYDTSLSDWKYIDASGVVVEDEFGAPVSLRKVKLSPEFELISAPEGDGVGEISISQFMKNTAPVTTFLVASGLNRVIQAGETVDIFQDFYSSFTEQFVASTGAEILGFSGLPFTRFAGTQGRIRFPDMERTSNGVIDISEVAISCRVSGTFVGNLDSTVSVDYVMIGNTGQPNTRLAVMAFERQFNLDFTARAQSLVSRLSKKTSTLIQNGAKFFIKVPPDAPSSFTLTGIDFLITVGR